MLAGISHKNDGYWKKRRKARKSKNEGKILEASEKHPARTRKYPTTSGEVVDIGGRKGVQDSKSWLKWL